MSEYGPITNGPRSWGGVLTEIERKLLCILTEYAKLNLPTHIDIDLHADLRTWKGKGILRGMHVNKYAFIALLSLIEQASIMGRQVQQLTWLQGSTASIGFWRTERIGKLIENI